MEKILKDSIINLTTACVNGEGCNSSLCSPAPSPTIVPSYKQAGGSNQTFSPLVIIMVGSLASSFLLVSYYVIIVKCCSTSHLLTRQRPRNDVDDIPSVEEENQNHTPLNPFWYVTTVGLDESIINSIAVYQYKKKDQEHLICSVCLNEFRNSENLRLLPGCRHAFHLPCIDTWLRSHVNCPLCRANIVSNSTSSSSPHHTTDQLQQPQSPDGHSSRETTEISSVDLATTNHHRILDMDMMIDDAMMIQQQPMRRSVSMDDFSSSTMAIAVADLHRTNSTTKSPTGTHHKRFDFGMAKTIVLKQSGNQSKFKHLGRPVAMKRSFSSSSNFFFSRRRSKSVLPF